MRKIRVLVVDDSSLVRALLRATLEQESDIVVVGEARDGRQAVEMSKILKPDIITMDIEMPVMSGIEAIDAIMCSKAVPIVVVSDVANAQNALDALMCGALDVMLKPDYTQQGWANGFANRVRLLAGVSVVTRRQPKVMQTGAGATYTSTKADTLPVSAGIYSGQVFVIASSTGGPQALAKILSALPADFPCPILIAQHIADGFAEGMVGWLNKLCKLPVRLAADGELVQAGVVLVSPSESHFALTASRRVTLTPAKPTDIYHPNCDVLLNSAAKVFGPLATAIILTGMGKDGPAGMTSIRKAGGKTIAQNEASSLIYGMNRIAIESGAIQQVMDLSDIIIAVQAMAWQGVSS